MTNRRTKLKQDRGSIALRPAAVALLVLSAFSGQSARAQDQTQWRESVERAIAYLSVEVEKWRPENGCFSCHNNGDGARALYLARTLGFEVPEKALAETTDWLLHPEKWDSNPGDPAVSDKKLARLQFSVALFIASGESLSKGAANQALGLVLADRTESGFWRVDSSSEMGSPVTWGNPLATLLAARMLSSMEEVDPGEHSRSAAKRALGWLAGLDPKTTIGKAVLIGALSLEISEGRIGQSGDRDRLAKKAASACERLLDAQGSDGGWGPHAGTPSEVFDTAVVLFHLDECVVAEHSGRSTGSARELALQFLYRTQAPAGGWPETTRPPGGQSYAQHISTTAWALMALLTEAIRSI